MHELNNYCAYSVSAGKLVKVIHSYTKFNQELWLSVPWLNWSTWNQERLAFYLQDQSILATSVLWCVVNHMCIKATKETTSSVLSTMLIIKVLCIYVWFIGARQKGLPWLMSNGSVAASVAWYPSIVSVTFCDRSLWSKTPIKQLKKQLNKLLW